MSYNHIGINGQFPHFDMNYKEGDGDKRSFLSWAVSVKRDFKKQDEQYYPSDLIPIKPWGPKADFIAKNFNQGDGVVISGRLQKDDDYEVEGETRKGQLYILVENVNFLEGAKSSGNDSTPSSAPTSKPSGLPPKTSPSFPSKKPPFNK